MIKLILKLTVISLILAACSVKEKKENKENKDLSSIENESSQKSENKNGSAKSVNSKLIEMKTPDAKSEDTDQVKKIKYDILDAAILSNDESKIKAACIKILQANSRDIKSLNALAMSSFKRGHSEAALLLLDKVLSIEPHSSAAYANRGLIYLSRNERNDAIQMFKKSLEYNSNNFVAAQNLGAIYVKEKDFSKAILALEKAVDKGKADENSMNNFAVALAATGKPKQAAEIYEKILKKNPSSKNTMFNLAIVLVEKLNKFDEGLDLINRLKFVGADFESRQVIKELEIKAKAGLK